MSQLPHTSPSHRLLPALLRLGSPDGCETPTLLTQDGMWESIVGARPRQGSGHVAWLSPGEGPWPRESPRSNRRCTRLRECSQVLGMAEPESPSGVPRCWWLLLPMQHGDRRDPQNFQGTDPSSTPGPVQGLWLPSLCLPAGLSAPYPSPC